MSPPPKYTRPENERRWLVAADAQWRSVAKPSWKTFHDRYLNCGRLRLRAVTDSDTGERTYKLGKKFESASPYTQPLVNIYLSEGEYEALCRLDATELIKTRHYAEHEGRTFSIDVFEGPLAGLVLCEVEAEGLEELMRISPPPFAWREVTEDRFFTGGRLCRTTPEELREALAGARS